MRRYCHLLAVLVVSICTSAVFGQVTLLTLPAGSPEDKALQQINNEPDLNKRMALLQEFVASYQANPVAVATGYNQMSQLAQANGDLKQALAVGDKALAAVPNSLELLSSQVGVAQAMKDYQKVVDYAVRGGIAYQGIARRAKAAGISDAQFAADVELDKKSVQPSYDYLEGAAYAAIASENSPKQRLAEIERFEQGFLNSRYEEQAMQFAIYSLQQMNDPARAQAYGEKLLSQNPQSVPTLLMLASTYAEDPKAANLPKALEYARKVLQISNPDGAGADDSKKLAAGVAHSTIGFALIKQEKTLQAVPELKKAVDLLRTETNAYSTVLYRLGFAYAKLHRNTEAQEVLRQAVTVPGPFQAASRELLAKVNTLAKTK